MAESTEANTLSDVGLYGLAVMGQNFALNMASHGFRVSVCNRTTSKVWLCNLADVTVSAAHMCCVSLFGVVV